MVARDDDATATARTHHPRRLRRARRARRQRRPPRPRARARRPLRGLPARPHRHERTRRRPARRADGQQRGRSPELRRRPHRDDGHLARSTTRSTTARSRKNARARRHRRQGQEGAGPPAPLRSRERRRRPLVARAPLRAHRRRRRRAGVPVVVHAFLDGRDVQPGTAPGYLGSARSEARGRRRPHRHRRGPLLGDGSRQPLGARRAGVPRHRRGQGARAAHARARASTRATPPARPTSSSSPSSSATTTGSGPRTRRLHFNFRPDRARELTRALAIADFDALRARGGTRPVRGPLRLHDDVRRQVRPARSRSRRTPTPNIFPEIVARAGLKQFRCAETEKYAHVTYFFNGGREEPFEGEDRKMLPSPKDVATYDLKPEMSAAGVADAVRDAIESGKYDFILVNFANPDMVGHTGHPRRGHPRGRSGRRGRRQDRRGGSRGGRRGAHHGRPRQLRAHEGPRVRAAAHVAHAESGAARLRQRRRSRRAAFAPAVASATSRRRCSTVLGLPQPPEMTGHSLLVRT